jgi:MFS family permease
MPIAIRRYMTAFFWELEPPQAARITASLGLSAVAAALLAPALSRRYGKRDAAIGLGLSACLLAPLPVAGRLLGWVPHYPDCMLNYPDCSSAGCSGGCPPTVRPRCCRR